MSTAIKSEPTRSVVEVNGVAVMYINQDGSIEAVSPPATPSGNQLVAMSQSKIISATAQNTTSGTFIDFSSIPSWAKRVTVMLSGVSTNGVGRYAITLGTSAGLVNSGYLGCTAYSVNSGVGGSNWSTYVDLMATAPAEWASLSGCLVLNKLTGNTWVITGSLGSPNSNNTVNLAGSIALSGALSRVRLTTSNGVDIFDAGQANVSWE